MGSREKMRLWTWVMARVGFEGDLGRWLGFEGDLEVDGFDGMVAQGLGLMAGLGFWG